MLQQKPPLIVNNRGNRFNNQRGSYGRPGGKRHDRRGPSNDHYYSADKPGPAWRKQVPALPDGYQPSSSGYTFGGKGKKRANKKFLKPLPNDEQFEAYSPVLDRKSFGSSGGRDEYFEHGLPPSAAGASQVAARVTARWASMLKKLHYQGEIELNPVSLLRTSSFAALRGSAYQFVNRWAYKFDIAGSLTNPAHANLARLTLRLISKRDKEHKMEVLGRWAKLIRKALSSQNL